MDTENKTAGPKKGGHAPEIVRESVSGLDVRQLLGLGRVEPDVVAPSEAVGIDFPVEETTNRQSREIHQTNTSAGEIVKERPEQQAAVTPAEHKPAGILPGEHPMRPSSSPRRPSRPVTDTQPVREESTPELTNNPSVQSHVASNVNENAVDNRRPIPPVTDPSELSSLRPSIDPLAVARPGSEKSAAAPNSVTPDPIIAANAKLQELASLSERTLEDYETFDDFNDAEPQRSKKTPIIILASLLCIGVLAGGVVFAYRQGVRESNNTTLPIIVAETKSAKEKPSNPGGVKIPHQNKLIYDRILGEDTDIAEKIVPREEKVATFSQKPAFTTLTKTTPSAKVAIPPVPAAPTSPASPANPLAGKSPATPNAVKKSAEELTGKLAAVTPPKPVSPPDSLINGKAIIPKLIKPDAGTPPAVTPRVTTQPLTETLKLPSKNTGEKSAGQGGDIVRLETVPVSGTSATPSVPQTTQQPSAEKLAIAKLVEETVKPGGESAVNAKVPPILPRRKPPAPSPAEKRLASASVPATSAPSNQHPSLAGGFVVQIAAFRSQEEALSRYAKLKRRHAALLKPYTSFIQRADLGDRGVYYRLRLGPIGGKEKASKLCRSLLSAGEKDCLVRTR